MSIFRRLFAKVEQVNKGDADVTELEEAFEMGISEEEAYGYWMETVENVILNTVKAANNEVERAFVFMDMREEPSFEIFYQVEGRLVWWDELDDPVSREQIRHKLRPQAKDVAFSVNEQFGLARHPKIAFAELQFEWETKAWFSHIIWSDTVEAQLPKDEAVHHWFKVIKEETEGLPLDSNKKLAWYP